MIVHIHEHLTLFAVIDSFNKKSEQLRLHYDDGLYVLHYEDDGDGIDIPIIFMLNADQTEQIQKLKQIADNTEVPFGEI